MGRPAKAFPAMREHRNAGQRSGWAVFGGCARACTPSGEAHVGTREHYFDCGPKGLRVSANQLSNVRLMQVNRHTHSPDSQIDHFHKHREAHGKVDVAFRYMHAESFAD
jgi:hypothetical protein